MVTITTNLGTGLRTLGMVTLDAEGEVTIRCADPQWAQYVHAALVEAAAKGEFKLEVRPPRGAREKQL